MGMLSSDYDTQNCISRVSEKIPRPGHSLRLADLGSPSGTKTSTVFSLSALTAPLREASASKTKSRDQGRHYFPICSNRSFRLRLGARPCLIAVNGTRGRVLVGGQAAAAASQPQQSTSASAGRPCESPCVRECRCLSQAGMGSAMENRNCMRDATESERDSVSRWSGGGRKIERSVAPLRDVLVYFYPTHKCSQIHKVM